MPAKRRVTDEEVVCAYRETGSVWKAGKLLGIVGQHVHRRLQALGHRLPGERWTEEEYDELRSLAGSCTLGEIAARLNRSYAAVAAKVSRLGLASNYGNRGARKLPRGAGFDKQTTRRRMGELIRFDGSLRQFCRARGLDVEAFVQAAQRHCPTIWDEYTRERSDLGAKECPYCSRVFYPLNAKQRNCSRKCATDERTDRDYFGGKRRSTIGLAEGVCQLCRREVRRGLSSHHVLGKENDPTNECLIALCSGCHKLVTLAASRSFVTDERAWQDFIMLVVQRKLGDRKTPTSYYVEVDLDIEDITEEELRDLIEREEAA